MVLVGKESTCQCKRCNRCRLDPQVGKIPWRRVGNPLRYSCLEKPMEKGSWRATIQRVAKSQTRLKQLSMHACLRNHLKVRKLNLRKQFKKIETPQCSLQHYWQDMETTEMSINRWMDKKMWHIYTMECHSAIKETGTMPFAATGWTQGLSYIKWCKSNKDKYMISLKCGIFKNDTNELIYKTEIDSQT